MELLDPLGDHVILHLALSDMSLEYHPSMELYSRDSLLIHMLSLDNVSSGFLSAFFASIPYFSPHTELEFISFRRCTILSLGDKIYDNSNLTLGLVDINCQTSVVQAKRPRQNKRSNSVANVIRAFPAESLRMLRCDGVTKSLFTQFTALKAPSLTSMTIQDCPGFTSDRLRSFLVARRRAVKSITDVVVSGRGPPLTVDTARWLQRETYWLKLEWNVERDESFASHDISNLHPLSPENKPWDRTRWGIPW